MQRRVVYEEPDPEVDDSSVFRVRDTGFQEFLEDHGAPAPEQHEAASRLGVGPEHEACVVGSEGGGEHSGAPGPPGIH